MASVVVGMGAGVEGAGCGAGGAGLGNKETGLGVESTGAARTKKGSKKEREAQMDLKAREWLKENDPEVADAPSAKDLRYAREQVQEFEMQEMLRERREAKALGAAIAEALAIVDPRSFGADISNTADEQQSDGFMVKRVAPQSAAVEMWPEGANSLLVGNAGTEASADNSTVELPTFGASSEKRFTKAELAGKVDITKHADTLLHVYRRNFVYSQLYRENIDRLDRLSQDDAYMRDRGYIMTESQMAYNKKGKDQDPPLRVRVLDKMARAWLAAEQEAAKEAASQAKANLDSEAELGYETSLASDDADLDAAMDLEKHQVDLEDYEWLSNDK